VHVRDFLELFWWGTRQATKWASIPACSGIVRSCADWARILKVNLKESESKEVDVRGY
jgi:hypothetical protein